MSQENVEIVRSILDAWGRGDFSSSDWADPDIEFVGADGAVAHGISEMEHRWSDFLDAWDHFVSFAEEIVDAGHDRVLVWVRFRGQGRGSGAPIADFPGANLLTLRGGKVVRLVLYTDKKKALEAAGLSE
jgi:ketosteroid isomerase-like protein